MNTFNSLSSQSITLQMTIVMDDLNTIEYPKDRGFLSLSPNHENSFKVSQEPQHCHHDHLVQYDLFDERIVLEKRDNQNESLYSQLEYPNHEQPHQLQPKQESDSSGRETSYANGLSAPLNHRLLLHSDYYASKSTISHVLTQFLQPQIQHDVVLPQKPICLEDQE